MKKKLSDILNASKVFKLLTTKHFANFLVSYKIARASKEIDDNVNFYLEEEKKIVDKYADKDENGNIKIADGNMITFSNRENSINFNKEIAALQSVEVDIFDTIQLELTDFKDQKDIDLTPSDLILLDGFIEFIDKNKKA